MAEKELAKKIREELMISKKEIDERIVEALKPYIRLTEDGKVIFLFDRTKVRVADQILLYLAAKKLAYTAGLVESDKATLDEVAKELAIPKGTAGPRLDELIKLGEVLKAERGVYEATLTGIFDLASRISRVLAERQEKAER